MKKTQENEPTNTEEPALDQPQAEAETGSETQGEAGKLAELNDRYMRLHADMDNLRRRTNADKLDTIKQANKDLIVSLLPVLDDFDRAADLLAKGADPAAVIEGINLVQAKMLKTLTAKGLAPIQSTGESFDPELHEAITHVAAGPESKGKVVDTVERGYQLNDKVIRYAKVVVGS